MPWTVEKEVLLGIPGTLLAPPPRWIPPVSAPPAGAGKVNRINATEAKGAKEAKTVVDVAAFASFASFAFQALAVAVALPG